MKINTLYLIIGLVVLLLIYAGVEFYSNSGRSKSLKSELVSIHPENVSKIVISSPEGLLTLSKQEENWSVSNENYGYSAVSDRVSNIITTVETITPSRMATRKPSKWSDFQVDSSGTRVQVFESDKETLDIVLGRLGMQGQQQYHTYVRLTDENDVYVADNFMSFAISADVSSYRNSQVITIPTDSIQTIAFNYPDESFSITKSLNNQWIMDNSTIDSTLMITYITPFSSKTSMKMFEGDPNKVFDAQQKISVHLASGEVVDIEAQQSGDTFFIRSSQNSDVLFVDNSLYNTFFKGRSSFYQEIE